MTHIARGLDSDGGLVLDIVVNGHILQLPSDASLIIKVHSITEVNERNAAERLMF